MDLLRDLLDKQVVDRNGREIGRVDGLLLDAPDDAPPRVVALEVGPSVAGRRISSIVGRWVEAMEHGAGVDEGRPLRIAIRQVLKVDDQVKVDLAVGETSAFTVERRLRRWVGAIPRSS